MAETEAFWFFGFLLFVLLAVEIGLRILDGNVKHYDAQFQEGRLEGTRYIAKHGYDAAYAHYHRMDADEPYDDGFFQALIDHQVISVGKAAEVTRKALYASSFWAPCEKCNSPAHRLENGQRHCANCAATASLLRAGD